MEKAGGPLAVCPPALGASLRDATASPQVGEDDSLAAFRRRPTATIAPSTTASAGSRMAPGPSLAHIWSHRDPPVPTHRSRTSRRSEGGSLRFTGQLGRRHVAAVEIVAPVAAQPLGLPKWRSQSCAGTIENRRARRGRRGRGRPDGSAGRSERSSRPPRADRAAALQPRHRPGKALERPLRDSVNDADVPGLEVGVAAVEDRDRPLEHAVGLHRMALAVPPLSAAVPRTFSVTAWPSCPPLLDHPRRWPCPWAQQCRRRRRDGPPPQQRQLATFFFC